MMTMLLYALHSDSDLGAEKICHKLSPNPELRNNAMSVAEKLIAEGLKKGRVEGRVEGLQKGLWIGKIQTVEDFLERVPSPGEVLDPLSVAELEAMHQGLHCEYERRFKRR
jgi:predicted transposase YdaD